VTRTRTCRAWWRFSASAAARVLLAPSGMSAQRRSASADAPTHMLVSMLEPSTWSGEVAVWWWCGGWYYWWHDRDQTVTMAVR
jgi:hypothetical protein